MFIVGCLYSIEDIFFRYLLSKVVKFSLRNFHHTSLKLGKVLGRYYLLSGICYKLSVMCCRPSDNVENFIDLVWWTFFIFHCSCYDFLLSFLFFPFSHVIIWFFVKFSMEKLKRFLRTRFPFRNDEKKSFHQIFSFFTNEKIISFSFSSQQWFNEFLKKSLRFFFSLSFLCYQVEKEMKPKEISNWKELSISEEKFQFFFKISVIIVCLQFTLQWD